RLAAGAFPVDAGPRVLLEGTLGARPLLMSHGGRQVTGHVVHVDRFGNLITNIPSDALPRKAHVRIGSVEIPVISLMYEHVARGRVVASVGAGEPRGVAARDGSAQKQLEVGRGEPVLAIGEPHDL